MTKEKEMVAAIEQLFQAKQDVERIKNHGLALSESSYKQLGNRVKEARAELETLFENLFEHFH